MPKRESQTKISYVSFAYVGTDNDFNRFLKAIIHDYLNAEPVAVAPPITNDKEKT